MTDAGHPLNEILRTIWRVSGHSIDDVARCITLGGIDFAYESAHGVFHRPEAADYHELSLLEFKAAMRGLLGWERITSEVIKNRFDLRYVDSIWQAYDLAHQAYMGEFVDWKRYRAAILNPAIEDQSVHWNVRGTKWKERSAPWPTPAAITFKSQRAVPLTAKDLGFEAEEKIQP